MKKLAIFTTLLLLLTLTACKDDTPNPVSDPDPFTKTCEEGYILEEGDCIKESEPIIKERVFTDSLTDSVFGRPITAANHPYINEFGTVVYEYEDYVTGTTTNSGFVIQKSDATQYVKVSGKNEFILDYTSDSEDSIYVLIDNRNDMSNRHFLVESYDTDGYYKESYTLPFTTCYSDNISFEMMNDELYLTYYENSDKTIYTTVLNKDLELISTKSYVLEMDVWNITIKALYHKDNNYYLLVEDLDDNQTIKIVELDLSYTSLNVVYESTRYIVGAFEIAENGIALRYGFDVVNDDMGIIVIDTNTYTETYHLTELSIVYGLTHFNVYDENTFYILNEALASGLEFYTIDIATGATEVQSISNELLDGGINLIYYENNATFVNTYDDIHMDQKFYDRVVVIYDDNE